MSTSTARQVNGNRITFFSPTRGGPPDLRSINYSVTDTANNQQCIDFTFEGTYTGSTNKYLRLFVPNPRTQTWQTWKYKSEQCGGTSAAAAYAAGRHTTMFEAIRTQVQPTAEMEAGIQTDVWEGLADHWQHSQN
ncbi:uncharacterized protein I303_107610 [Kwoniella dejecticola CBS 10117]|uniref:Uncharacterized protein n=1 Tax=Kwoniella dejecticola CBS 10117 TaxID=1296121 RepID=A0A1A5ZV76_9TREE|nr:uncharacterized protein I303_07621 [Kwoniella dejecticola CBS 10117]OBR81711.1 hypothetical protein I303_07621 [Kwoniella dejecticola CBS 10117]